MATTSSSATFTYEWTYDVFISFRGVDTRLGFTGNLYKALCAKEVNAFMDDQELEKGAKITPTLDKAIQESRIALVIFSKNYAASTFCLEELAKIMDCSEEKGMLVWPVFYHVNPAEVRHQKGSYAEAIAKHEARNYEKRKLERWKLALENAANLSGWHFRPDGDKYEHEFIENIIQSISKKISSLRDDNKQQPTPQSSRFQYRGVEHLPDKRMGSKVREIVRWIPPPRDYVKLNVAGTFKKSKIFPTMGSGGLIRSVTGAWIVGFISQDGPGEIFLAELLAIKHGLTLAWNNGFRKVKCETGAMEVVELLQKRSAALEYHKFASVLTQIMDLLSRSWTVEISHVYIEANRCADFMAKDAARNILGWRLFQEVPPLMRGLVLEEQMGCTFVS